MPDLFIIGSKWKPFHSDSKVHARQWALAGREGREGKDRIDKWTSLG